jgi:glycosyltransferase involved in cell wall biosynthesis
MRILFCSENPLDPTLGASKVLLEVSDAMRQRGWQCEVAGDVDICPSIRSFSGLPRFRRFTEALAVYIERRGADFDVVEYDHRYLPFPRRRFSATTLMVARAQLLAQHLDRIRIPTLSRWRSRIGWVVKGASRRAFTRRSTAQADLTCREADLINVCNDDARIELQRRGFDGRKIILVPNGLSRERLARFPAVPPALPPEPRVAFVGTFDLRKGQREFPDIVRRITRELPAARVRLLGARDRTTEDVLSFFPRDLWPHLEVIPTYAPDELPALLSACSVGVFPSYVEGFPAGVLEMLAAGLPVFAYRAPGAPMMLPDAHLTPPGDSRALSDLVVTLLRSPDRLAAARRWARARAEAFPWDAAAEKTARSYTEHLEIRRGHAT